MEKNISVIFEMIDIKDKSQCCGCEACVQRCPKRCISLVEDAEGFLYPQVDTAVCVDCGLCEKVCPVLNQSAEREPQAVYAAINPDADVRQQSSSGGVFSMLADAVLSHGGVVFGVCWNDDWQLVFDYTESKDDLSRFRGSKYLQAHVGDAYIRVESFLKLGRQVLFTGTPCQIAALKRYLKKDYDNLLAVDVICHGAPSPGVFRTYLTEEISRIAADEKNTVSSLSNHFVAERNMLNTMGWRIENIQFRDKRLGWKKFSFTLCLSKALAAGEQNSVSLSYSLNENIFMRGFLRDFYLRPSCYSCLAKSGKSGSDITLGDFWGINELKPEIDDDRGVSAVTINSDKGALWFDKFSLQRYEMSYGDLCRYNSALVRSVACPPQRAKFFKQYGKQSFFSLVDKLCVEPFWILYYKKVRWHLCRIYKLIFK